MEELSRGLLDTSVLIAREEDSRLESSLPQEIAISVASRYRPFWELEARMLGAAPEPAQGQRAAAGNQEQIVI